MKIRKATITAISKEGDEYKLHMDVIEGIDPMREAAKMIPKIKQCEMIVVDYEDEREKRVPDRSLVLAGPRAYKDAFACSRVRAREDGRRKRR